MAQGTFFDQRFLGRYAGSIMSDPATALIELVANSWDAFSTEVRIRWPEKGSDTAFSITDNGFGMSRSEFESRWRTLDYDRISNQGKRVLPPQELSHLPPRTVYGRNGRGRHAAFLFSSPYEVRTWKDGRETIFRVSQTIDTPIHIAVVAEKECQPGHGTEVRALSFEAVGLSAQKAREVLGSRFLTDPNFKVYINGAPVSFDDIPPGALRELSVIVPELGTARVLVIDSQRVDRSTRQHGVAWHVNNRLVGECHWRTSDYERILDGRRSEAKRYTFIVLADFLADAVLPDWSDFDPANENWKTTRSEVQDHIRNALADFNASQRSEVKEEVRERHRGQVSQLAPLSRERWNNFVDQVVDNCPSIRGAELDQVAGLLAKLERANSRYALIGQLDNLSSGALDTLHQILTAWTVSLAKETLDEISTRLKLIQELDKKFKDPNTDEVQDLQPLFEKALWIFGPEFETMEFTSNRGMTEVISKIFGGSAKGSLNRPDFVVLPESTVGLYSRPSYDGEHEAIGVGALVVVELKKPGVPIGDEQKAQAWKYVKELLQKRMIDDGTKVTCFVLGDSLRKFEGEIDTKGKNVTIHPIIYNNFIMRAERRMLNLYRRLQDAPFLKEHGVDADAFTKAEPPKQTVLFEAS